MLIFFFVHVEILNSTTSSYAKHGHFGEFPAVQYSFLSLQKKDIQ